MSRLGPELIINPSFDATGDWTAYQMTIAGNGYALLDNDYDAELFQDVFGLVGGTKYRVVIDFEFVSGAGVLLYGAADETRFQLGYNPTTSYHRWVNGINSFDMIAGDGALGLELVLYLDVAATLKIHSISVREVIENYIVGPELVLNPSFDDAGTNWDLADVFTFVTEDAVGYAKQIADSGGVLQQDIPSLVEGDFYRVVVNLIYWDVNRDATEGYIDLAYSNKERDLYQGLNEFELQAGDTASPWAVFEASFSAFYTGDIVIDFVSCKKITAVPGSELITNGIFTDSFRWTNYSGTTLWESDYIKMDPKSAIKQGNLFAELGKEYSLKFTVSGYTVEADVGEMILYFGSADNIRIFPTGGVEYEYRFTLDYIGDPIIYLYNWDDTDTIKLENVSLMEVPPIPPIPPKADLYPGGTPADDNGSFYRSRMQSLPPINKKKDKESEYDKVVGKDQSLPTPGRFNRPNQR